MSGRPWSGPFAALAAVCIMTAGAAAQDRAVPPWLPLYGVAINGEAQCYVVGGKGRIFVSEDEGKTWSPRVLRERPGARPFQDLDLYDVKFAPDGKNGWIIGEQGLIFHTGDGGADWEEQTSGVKANLFRIAVVDARHAHVAGGDGALLSTSDGGRSWTARRLRHISYFDIAFTSVDNGWTVGEFSTVLGTTDGGRSWQLKYGGNPGDFQAGPFLAIVFAGRRGGWALGLNGASIFTNDGGKTWRPRKLPLPMAVYVGAPDRTRDRVWFGGRRGQMLSLDSAGHWTRHRVVFNAVTDLAFAGKLGLAVGLNGTILRSGDGGKEWHPVR